MAQLIAFRGPPSITSGGFPSDEEVRAPIRRKGSATRSTGRRRREASPVITVRKGRPATTPASMRSVDPELAASSGLRRSLQALRPPAHDLDRPAVAPGLDAERFEAPQRRRAIVRGREVAEPALPVREGAHDGETVRERLVPGKGEPTSEMSRLGDSHGAPRREGIVPPPAASVGPAVC
jgi:hypothetical protein